MNPKMKFTRRKINWFVLFKIPSAFFSGVRVTKITTRKVVVEVKFRWINQNPFKSMYWATQGMASELATGVVMMQEIDNTGEKFSMLVTQQTGEFVKKAVGKITFVCVNDGRVAQALKKAITTGTGQEITLHSEGVDEEGAVVSKFTYQWSVKRKRC
jgi:hypothetical protein